MMIHFCIFFIIVVLKFWFDTVHCMKITFFLIHNNCAKQFECNFLGNLIWVLILKLSRVSCLHINTHTHAKTIVYVITSHCKCLFIIYIYKKKQFKVPSTSLARKVLEMLHTYHARSFLDIYYCIAILCI
jgi:hypothetical protein